MSRRGWPLWLAGLLLPAVGVQAALMTVTWLRARQALAHPPARAADVALVLGNRAWIDGRPNPCLTGRVDAALALLREGKVRRLAVSGGRDREDGRIEAEVMRQHAREAGHDGDILMESASSSTRQNLLQSARVLDAAGVRSVIVVSDPYHLWRAERLARATGFDGRFDVQYAAAATPCWRRWGMLHRGALREPLAIAHNAAHGWLH